MGYPPRDAYDYPPRDDLEGDFQDSAPLYAFRYTIVRTDTPSSGVHTLKLVGTTNTIEDARKKVRADPGWANNKDFLIIDNVKGAEVT